MSTYAAQAPTWEGLTVETRSWLRARLDAADMISDAEAAQMLDVNSQVIDDLVRTRCFLGVRAPGETWRLPRWQFEEPIYSTIEVVLEALQLDGWGALAWLETPLGGLNGRTPRAALEQGAGARVVELARAEGV